MPPARLATIAAVWALTACGIEARYDDTRFDCSGGAACPAGFACVAEVCVPDGERSPAADAGTGAGAECGRASDVSDDFDDGAIADDWTASRSAGASYAETGGQAVFELPSQQMGAAAYSSECAYDVTDDEVAIRVSRIQHGSGGAEAFFGLFGDGGEVAAVHERDGTLHMTVVTQGATTTTSVGYDPEVDRWWRISGDGDEVEFSFSADGQTWQKRGEGAIPAGLPRMRVSFGVRAEAASSGVRTAQFDDYNGG